MLKYEVYFKSSAEKELYKLNPRLKAQNETDGFKTFEHTKIFVLIFYCFIITAYITDKIKEGETIWQN